MTLAELYTALEGLENGSNYVSTIKAEIAKLNSEAKSHREEKEKATAALEVMTKERDGLTAKLSDVETSGDATNKDLKKQLEALQKKFDAVESARQEAENKRIQADIQAQVVDALTKGNAMDPQELSKLLVGNIKTADDGSYTYTKSDGTTGTIQDGVSDWLKGKPWAVKSTQNAGSGESSRASGAEGNDVQQEFEKALGI